MMKEEDKEAFLKLGFTPLYDGEAFEKLRHDGKITIYKNSIRDGSGRYKGFLVSYPILVHIEKPEDILELAGASIKIKEGKLILDKI